jgi:hypothetical protein
MENCQMVHESEKAGPCPAVTAIKKAPVPHSYQVLQAYTWQSRFATSLVIQVYKLTVGRPVSALFDPFPLQEAAIMALGGNPLVSFPRFQSTHDG